MRAAAATPPRPIGRSGARDKRSEAYLQRSPQRRGLPADRIRNVPTRSSPLSSSTSSSSPSSSSTSSSSSSSSSSRKKKEKFQRKYYQLIANDHEKIEANSLRSIRRKRLIRYLKPPGYEMRDSEGNPKDPKFPEIRCYGRKIFKALAAFVRTMHGKHLTLNGNIQACKMLWIASSRSIKLRNPSPDDFSEFTTDGGEKDYDAIADVIEKDLLRGFKLPEDMKDWVKLLRASPLKNRYLVRCHVALMAPKAKVAHFIVLYERLRQVQKLASLKAPDGKGKHIAVLDNIPVGDTTKDHVWMTDVRRNKYVKEVFTYKRELYQDNTDSLLRLARNCTQHLLDHSVEVNKIKFRYKDMYCMIESCFSGLFHQFQRAMLQAGFKDNSLKETM